MTDHKRAEKARVEIENLRAQLGREVEAKHVALAVRDAALAERDAARAKIAKDSAIAGDREEELCDQLEQAEKQRDDALANRSRWKVAHDEMLSERGDAKKDRANALELVDGLRKEVEKWKRMHDGGTNYLSGKL